MEYYQSFVNKGKKKSTHTSRIQHVDGLGLIVYLAGQY